MDSILKKERVVYCSINAVKSNIKKKNAFKKEGIKTWNTLEFPKEGKIESR